MSQSETKKFFSFFKEVIVVLIGVLIALFINEWRETRNNEQFVESVLEAVEQDIKSSQEDLDKVTKKHIRTLDSVALYLENEERSILHIIQNVGGIQYASTKNISLNYMVANRAELLDYELISLLANVEQNSDLLSSKFDKLMDYAYETVEASDAKSKRIFIIHLSNVIDSEQSLLNLYDQFLQSDSTSASKQGG